MCDVNHFERIKKLQSKLESNNNISGLLYKEDFVHIVLNTEHHWLYVNWIGYQSEESIKKGSEKVLEALEQFGLSKVLNDNTNVIGIWTPVAKWLGANWLPRMEKAGLKHFAWVYSASRLSQVSANEAISNTPLPNLIKTFYNITDAEKWLQQPSTETIIK